MKSPVKSSAKLRSLRLFRAAALAVAATSTVAVFPPAQAVAAPEPSPVPLRWQLEFTPGPLRVAMVDIPGQGRRAFFYMPYKAVNNTGQTCTSRRSSSWRPTRATCSAPGAMCPPMWSARSWTF